jgi:hypothetical protein
MRIRRSFLTKPEKALNLLDLQDIFDQQQMLKLCVVVGKSKLIRRI